MQKRDLTVIREIETINFLLETGVIDKEEASIMRNYLETAS